jgi:hypothetical protein
MKELIATLIPSSSALFVLTRRPTPDRERLLEELKGLSGKIFNAAFARRPSQTAGCLKRRKISRPLGLSGFPERHYEYHSKVLGRLATLLNLYGQAQASGSDLMLSNRL